MEKNGTFASPAMARASSVLPVPGGPISSTPLGMRPPSFWNFCGSRRNSMISCSSSLASSTPATSLKVTFFCWLASSLALDLPKESALLPPLCICRMKKTQKPTSRANGATDTNRLIQAGPSFGWTMIVTLFACRVSTSLSDPNGLLGATVRKAVPPLCSVLYLPLISEPVIVTSATWPLETSVRKVLKLTGCSFFWNWAKWTTTATMARIEAHSINVLRVEFTI